MVWCQVIKVAIVPHSKKVVGLIAMPFPWFFGLNDAAQYSAFVSSRLLHVILLASTIAISCKNLKKLLLFMYEYIAWEQ